MTVTKKQERAAETERHQLQTGWIRDPDTRGWHRLEYDGEIGVTKCDLVVGVGGIRKSMPGAGALICALCVRKLR